MASEKENIEDNNTSSIFFDNSQEHINTMKTLPFVMCVKIPEKQNANDILLPLSTNPHFIGISRYVIHALTSATNKDSFDTYSGLRVNELEILKKWIQQPSSAQRYALFDWDRTITKIEGLMINFPTKDGRVDGTIAEYSTYLNEFYKPYDETFNFTPEVYMQYLCGMDRMDLLRDIFAECIVNKVQIVILTNNAGCKTDGKTFRELMETVGVKDFDIICSVLYGGNKRVAFKMYLYKKSHQNATNEELAAQERMELEEYEKYKIKNETNTGGRRITRRKRNYRISKKRTYRIRKQRTRK